MKNHRPGETLFKISLAYLGMLVGLTLGYIASKSLPLDVADQVSQAIEIMGAVAGAILGWRLPSRFGVQPSLSDILRTKQPIAAKPYVLDTSVIIDGRIAEVVETRILDNPLVVPSFVLRELQGIADSADKLRRARGRRGLDVLNKLRSGTSATLRIEEHEAPGSEGQPVDQKLVLLARHLGGKVVTGDYNLNKVARLHDVEVVNLNDLAQSLRPAVLPGETLDVMVVKPGEEAGQGIGYLEDGTMIVVEQGRDKINETIKITVTSVLQTSAGRMIFGRA